MLLLIKIPYNCTVGRLFDICALAGKVTWMDLQMDKEGKTKGMAVCEYSHPIEAVQAVSMLNGQRLLDRTLAVRMDRYPKDIERRDPGGLPVCHLYQRGNRKKLETNRKYQNLVKRNREKRKSKNIFYPIF